MHDPILKHFANVRRMQKFKAMIMVAPPHPEPVPPESELAGLREQILGGWMWFLADGCRLMSPSERRSPLSYHAQEAVRSRAWSSFAQVSPHHGQEGLRDIRTRPH